MRHKHAMSCYKLFHTFDWFVIIKGSIKDTCSNIHDYNSITERIFGGDTYKQHGGTHLHDVESDAEV